MNGLPKMFRHDHVLRDQKGLPVGRVVLVDDSSYEEGEPIAVALMTVPLAKMMKLKGRLFYVDGIPYKLPDDISALKMKTSAGKHLVNNFYLEPA